MVKLVYAWLALIAAAPAYSAPPDTSAEKAYGYLEMIAGKIGERPAGSDAESRSVEYISQQFKSWASDAGDWISRVDGPHGPDARTIFRRHPLCAVSGRD